MATETKSKAGDRLLSRQEAADMIGVKKTTLEHWHCQGTYDLPCVKSGGLAKYWLSDILKFLESRTEKHSGCTA